MSGAHEVSHGRGGAGNIGDDATQYVDGEVTRVGEEGTGVSTGRGGAGNIDAAHAKDSAHRTDKEHIPAEAEVKKTTGENFHSGVGGAGNEHHVKHDGKLAGPVVPGAAGEQKKVGTMEKIKAKINGLMHKK